MNWDLVMQRYRILESDGEYVVKKRFLWAFWRLVLEQDGYDHFRPIVFASKAEAESWIESDFSQRGERRVWRRVK